MANDKPSSAVHNAAAVSESIRIENQNRAREKRQLFLISLTSVVICLLIWEIAVRTALINPKYLSAPSQVFQSFITKFYDPKPDGAILPVHFISSLYLALVGYFAAVIIGIPLGLVMGYSKVFYKLINPIFEIVRPIPPIAWIPLSVIWLGIGTTAKGFIIFLAAFVPCVINAYTGVHQTNPTLINVAKTCGANDWQIFTTVCIPSALPLTFTGLRVALGNSWSTLVAAELLSAKAGLGYMIQQGRSLVRPDIIIVGMLSIGITGALLSACLIRVEKKFVKGRNAR